MKLTLGLILLLSFAGAGSAQELPDGKGKALVQRICSKCHGLESITSARATRERWENIVDDMVGRGAEGTDEEFDTIIEYLATNFGRSRPATKIAINKATAKDLVGSLGMPQADADAIVQYREKNGDFKDFEDLKKVPGIDQKLLETYKGRFEY